MIQVLTNHGYLITCKTDISVHYPLVQALGRQQWMLGAQSESESVSADCRASHCYIPIEGPPNEL